MITPFRAMSFKDNDVITKDDTDQMQNNLQWLNDNTPRGRLYREDGPSKDAKLVMICGRISIPKSKKDNMVIKRVRFGKAFSANSRPNVTTGIIADAPTEIFCVVNGLDGQVLPTAAGCEIKVHVPDKNTSDKWKISKPLHVHWQAFGFREDDMNEF